MRKLSQNKRGRYKKSSFITVHLIEEFYVLQDTCKQRNVLAEDETTITGRNIRGNFRRTREEARFITLQITEDVV